MQKKNVSTLAAAALLLAAVPSAHAFDVGGSNGWKFSTDGFLNVFATYQTTQPRPGTVAQLRGGLGSGDPSAAIAGDTGRQQEFRVRTGLLPVGVGFNINSPTINGVDYAVRIAMYPQVNNTGKSHTDITPNVDFREVNMTATGSFGQILAGRAINLYQSKNILTDMTLFGAGVVGPVNNGPTMGHIGYGYLFPNFGAQFRYTTPDIAGFKVAVSVNEPSGVGNTSGDGFGAVASKTNIPRIEGEISYGTTLPGGKLQAWIEGMYNQATFLSTEARPGAHAISYGGSGGVEVGFGPLDLLASCYGGQALGMLGITSDGIAGELDAVGNERQNWGYLAQATFQITPSWKLGINYGQSNAELTDNDRAIGGAEIKSQRAAVGMVTYNVNKFVQIIGEATWAQNKWHTGQHQDSQMAALGTFIYW